MEKLKVYLDTSVISHLMQEDVPEKMADTLKLWDMFKDGKYDVTPELRCGNLLEAVKAILNDATEKESEQ